VNSWQYYPLFVICVLVFCLCPHQHDSLLGNNPRKKVHQIRGQSFKSDWSITIFLDFCVLVFDCSPLSMGGRVLVACRENPLLLFSPSHPSGARQKRILDGVANSQKTPLNTQHHTTTMTATPSHLNIVVTYIQPIHSAPIHFSFHHGG
jgi:hypothetical protein